MTDILDYLQSQYQKLQQKIVNTPQTTKDKLIDFIEDPSSENIPNNEVLALVNYIQATAASYCRYINCKQTNHRGWFRFVQDYSAIFTNNLDSKLVTKNYKIGDFIDTLHPKVVFQEDTLDEYVHTVDIPITHVEEVYFDPYTYAIYDESIGLYRYINPECSTSSIIWE